MALYLAAHDRTYFAVDPEGTFRETQAGRGSFDTIVDDIVTGQYEVAEVYQALGDRWNDVSEIVADAVYARLLKQNTAFVPSFMVRVYPLKAEELRRRSLSPEEARGEREELRAYRDGFVAEAAE